MRRKANSYPINMDTARAFFDWGLQLPEKAVSRRVARHFSVRGVQHLVDLPGPGCIQRLWVTGGNIGRELVLRIYFDGEKTPHVEAPLSDFFGVMHNLSERYSQYWEYNETRAPYTINTPFIASKPHNGFTCYFPMPFSRSARIEIENDSGRNSDLYCIIDWHAYPDAELKEAMRFCARWRREAPARDYQDDFLVLDAAGPGRLAGFVHSIDMLHDRDIMRWSHAGSDNIYIDGRGPHPAYLRGIGGEDTFGTSFGGHTYRPQSALFSDMPYYIQKNPGDDRRQKLVGYRFFANDALRFDRSVHFRFGARAHDIATTVYWYSAAAVRPFTNIPPYKDRLPGTRPRRRYDLPLTDSGQWWITGPFPDTFAEPLPTEKCLDPNQPFHDRLWRCYEAKRGFVDFNHVFRPLPTNRNSATLTETVAFARCRIQAPEALAATLTFGWDDRLAYRLNGAPEVDLGRNDIFDSQTVRVELREGVNELGVSLTNTTGLSSGGWCFSFGAVTDGGIELSPCIEYPPPPACAGRLLALDFSAGSPRATDGYRPFVPSYSHDQSGEVPAGSVELICSPQTQVVPTLRGPVEVTVAGGDNSILGFYRQCCGVDKTCGGESGLLNGEVRAEPNSESKPASLELILAGLPPGEYSLTSIHRCPTQDCTLRDMQMSVNGRTVGEDTVTWSSAGTSETVDLVTLPIHVNENDEIIRIAYQAENTVVINAIKIS